MQQACTHTIPGHRCMCPVAAMAKQCSFARTAVAHQVHADQSQHQVQAACGTGPMAIGSHALDGHNSRWRPLPEGFLSAEKGMQTPTWSACASFSSLPASAKRPCCCSIFAIMACCNEQQSITPNRHPQHLTRDRKPAVKCMSRQARSSKHTSQLPVCQVMPGSLPMAKRLAGKRDESYRAWSVSMSTCLALIWAFRSAAAVCRVLEACEAPLGSD